MQVHRQPLGCKEGDVQLRVAAASLMGSLAVLTAGGVGVAAEQSTGLSHSGSQGSVGSSPSAQDQTFMRQNARTDLAEIMTGKLASQRGTTAGIWLAAQTIISDHQQALSKLQGVAQGAKVTLPTSLTELQEREVQAEKGTSGAAFDKLYLRNEVTRLQQSVAQTQQEIQSGSDQRVVDFAKSYLPMAQNDLSVVQQL
jgi:putative membrane protein